MKTAIRVLALAATAAVFGCASSPSRRHVDPAIFESDYLRVSYFRFDDLQIKRHKRDPGGDPRRVGASAWIVYSKSWARRNGQKIRESYIKAFPRAEVAAHERKAGVLVAKGVVDDQTMRRNVKEILSRGFVELPPTPPGELTRKWARSMYEKLNEGRFYRILSIQSDRGTHTVALTSVMNDEALARRFVNVEVYAAAFVSRNALAIGVRVGGKD